MPFDVRVTSAISDRTQEEPRTFARMALKGMTPEQLWASPHGFGSAGFHILHIAGSTERLMSYLQNRNLTAEQMRALRDEGFDVPLVHAANSAGALAHGRARYSMVRAGIESVPRGL